MIIVAGKNKNKMDIEWIEAKKKCRLNVETVFIFNALDMEFRTVKLKRNPKCPVCGDNPTITKLQDYEQPVCDLKNK